MIADWIPISAIAALIIIGITCSLVVRYQSKKAEIQRAALKHVQNEALKKIRHYASKYPNPLADEVPLDYINRMPILPIKIGKNGGFHNVEIELADDHCVIIRSWDSPVCVGNDNDVIGCIDNTIEMYEDQIKLLHEAAQTFKARKKCKHLFLSVEEMKQIRNVKDERKREYEHKLLSWVRKHPFVRMGRSGVRGNE